MLELIFTGIEVMKKDQRFNSAHFADSALRSHNSPMGTPNIANKY